jgi:hypothetical protein
MAPEHPETPRLSDRLSQDARGLLSRATDS